MLCKHYVYKAEEESKRELNEKRRTSLLPSVGSPFGGAQISETSLVEFLNSLNCWVVEAGLTADKKP